MLDSKTYARIKKLKVPVADLADGCRKLGLAGRVADPSLRPAVPLSRLAGTAVTVREYLADTPCDYALRIADVYDLGQSVPRAVLVIRNEVPGFAAMGSGGARVALAHGYVGCVVAGAIRDTQEMPDIGFPLFGTAARADSIGPADTPPGKSINFELGGPVGVAGITISPGDIIVGDNDGLIAISLDQIEAVLNEAEKIVAFEHRLFAMLKTGASFREIINKSKSGGTDSQGSPPASKSRKRNESRKRNKSRK
jgi:4-hydroxy-4-methyl-2-oxoglutarate aldolase